MFFILYANNINMYIFYTTYLLSYICINYCFLYMLSKVEIQPLIALIITESYGETYYIISIVLQG